MTEDYAEAMTRLQTLHNELGWVLRDSQTQPAKLDRAKVCVQDMKQAIGKLEAYVRLRRGE